MSQPSLPPAMLLRSFLTVASGYVMTMLSLFSTFLLLGYLLFPGFVKFLGLSVEERENIMTSDPWSIIPIEMFCLAVVFNCALCALIGWLVVRTAPFAFFPHAVFVAVLMFVTHLQKIIQDAPAEKTMTLVYLLCFPVSLLIGAKISANRLIETTLEY
jgi:hypothetical protein